MFQPLGPLQNAMKLLLVIPLLALVQPPVQDEPPAEPRTRNVAIVLFQGVELLDFAGPGEVFSAVRIDGGRPFRVYTVAVKPDLIVSQGFVRITPEYTLGDCPEPDIVVIPGGAAPASDRVLRRWLIERSEKSEILMSVCNGATVLAAAGLLAGQEVTTHHGSFESVQLMEPTAIVLSNRRFVDQGRIVTSAGVSAGIDGSLHVVTRLLGEDAARRTALYMEYDWRPEELAALHAQPGGRVGDSSPSRLIAILREGGTEAALARYRARSVEGGEAPDEMGLNRAGYVLMQSGRMADATGLFQLVVAAFPGSSNACDSLSEAYELAGKNELAVQWSEKALALLDADETISEDLRVGVREASEARIGRIHAGVGSGNWVCPPCGPDCHEEIYDGSGVCSGCGMKLVPRSSVTQVAIFLPQQTELLSMAGPAAVLRAADVTHVYTVSDTIDPIRCPGIATLVPQYDFDDVPPCDVLIVPDTRAFELINDDQVLEWLAHQAGDAKVVLATGMGCLLLAKAGALDEGVEVPVWGWAVERMSELLPGIALTAERAEVEHGRFFLAREPGTSIQHALRVVERIGDAELAATTAARLALTWLAEER